MPTVGLMRSSFMRAMEFQLTTKFLPGSRWFLGSLLFITDMFGDLSLQEPESCKVIRSGTGRLPPTSVQVSLINEAQLGHRLSKLGKTNSDLARDKADHTLSVPTGKTHQIYQSSPESDSEGSREVYMVVNEEELLEKTVKQIQWEADEEIARACHLATEAERGQRHNGQHDDSGALDDEIKDGTPMRRLHPKFNSWCPTDRDRLLNRS
jgi:hypothetical protein